MRSAFVFAVFAAWLMGAAGLIDFHVCIGAPSTCVKEAKR